MSFPFMIWTMQRSGGTSLTDLLMAMSEHRSAEHEPFNWAKKKPRQFWPITEAWNTTHNAETLRTSLDGLFSQRFLIKHCYELLNMSFNMHLMQAAAATDYRHVLLMRRDEPSRLVSKFIAEAQGTWFKDYARQVFSEVAEGDRQLEALPVERVVDHYRHCQQATTFIRKTLHELKVPVLPVAYEDLYLGDRKARLGHLRTLFDFLGFTPATLDRHARLIEEKIFHSGQNTPSVAPHVPNLPEVVAELRQAGCTVETNVLGAVSPEPKVETQGGPYERIARECADLARAHATRGPYLEIATSPNQRPVLQQAQFAGEERQVVTTGDTELAEGLTACPVDPHDMRGSVEDGRFGTVLWTGGLSQDRCFWRTTDEIRRVLAPGGTLIVVAPGFGRTGPQSSYAITGKKGNRIKDATITYRAHQNDYWRISAQGLRESVLQGFTVLDVKMMMMPPRLFGVAVKPA